MNSRRIAAVLAAAAIAPAVLLSTPAVAAAKPAGTAQATEIADRHRTAGWHGPDVTVTGPATLTAGNWAELKLTVDNRQGETTQDFVTDLDITGLTAVKTGKVDLEYRTQDGTWDQALGTGRYFRLRWGTVKKGDTFTTGLRVRFAPHVSGPARIMTYGNSNGGTEFADHLYMFDVLPAGKQ
ncbi:hypothetical protein [Streptomyces olivoreticuli]|uniref:hypothetical protein n=1 Tax=Streptomyces olivoreticuli TaxID=68246 RepID=UPI000E23E404|nr:hypothetical protein [Streptomyces olivoreticuli]